MSQAIILACDAEAYAACEIEHASLRDKLFRHLCDSLGYEEPAALTESQRAELEEELDDLTNNWDEADVGNMNLKADTELQHMFAQYVDLSNSLGAYQDAGLEEVVERWYGGRLPRPAEDDEATGD